MKNETKTPFAFGHVEPIFSAGDSGFFCGWRFTVARCPFCAKRHFHGAGSANEHPPDLVGQRVAHCRTGPGRGREYFLIVSENKTRPATNRRTGKGPRLTKAVPATA